MFLHDLNGKACISYKPFNDIMVFGADACPWVQPMVFKTLRFLSYLFHWHFTFACYIYLLFHFLFTTRRITFARALV